VYNRILVTLDGSEYAECILPHVKSIAAGCHIPQVDLLTVVEPFSSQIVELPMEWQASVKKQGLEWATQYLQKIRSDLTATGISSLVVVREGLPVDVMLDYVNKNNIDLVMLSTHGRSGLSRFAFGSVADRFVRECPVPVFLSTPGGCRLP
jgi:nucleotide-binding universal stress UspA family protein